MNARQKAKYYKKKYEELANMKLPPYKIETRKIDTIHFSRCYPTAFAVQDGSYMRQVLSKDLGLELAEHLGKYMRCSAEELPHLNQIKFTAEIDVVLKEC